MDTALTSCSWLGVIRHGESTANVAREAAERSGAESIDVPERDADVTLTPTGVRQAVAVGRWLHGLPADRRPDIVVSSPYRRAVQTARIALNEANLGAAEPRLRLDERLRDRELGVLDLLTARGCAAWHPEEVERRRRLGKFYHRPPGGESWADVALRLRAVLTDLNANFDGRRVLLFGHEAVIYLLRYVLEELTEPQLMSAARSEVIANGSLTSWRCVDGQLGLDSFNEVGHLLGSGAVPTSQPTGHAGAEPLAADGQAAAPPQAAAP